MTRTTTLLLGLVALAGCDPDSQREPFDFDSLLGTDGKADMLSSSHVVREVDMNSTLTGDFDPRVRVYGFSVKAKVGAELDIAVATAAGADSIDVDEGEELDTVLAVYGPMQNGKPGPLVAQVDDDDSGLAAQLPPITVEEEGEYLVLLSSWNDTGHGQYIMDMTCNGTDFQCQRPVDDSPCVEGTEFIVGGQSVGTTTWKRCNYVLLEETHVEEGAVLTVAPGVKIKGNFLGEAPFGEVRFVVDGVVQAVGTKEHPVVFTALTEDGWGGIVLNGGSTLQHTFVEKAEVGVEVVGNGNVLEDININSGQTGIVFRGETEGHRINRGRIAKVTNGIVMEATVVDIADTVILGNGGVGTGIRGKDTTASFFKRALVAGFGIGIDLESAELEMVDATITNNIRGVHVTGADAGINPGYTCPPQPSFTIPPPRTWPPAPTTWRRDPIFRRVDLVGNEEYAVRIDAPELLVIEDSNIRRNGAGIIIASDSLHDDSRITGNNIFDNGDGPLQLDAFHRNGTLDISGNYWAEISDPDLSASWRNSHTVTIAAEDAECHLSRTGTPSGCTSVSGGRRCGSYFCTFSSPFWNCDVTVDLQSEPWTGELVFTGFSPVLLDAGPADDALGDSVKQEREEQGL